MCIYIYIYIYIRTYVRTYVRTYIHTYTHTYIHTHAYINIAPGRRLGGGSPRAQTARPPSPRRAWRPGLNLMYKP